MEESYAGFVRFASELATWLSAHTFIAILFLAVPSGVLTLAVNLMRNAQQTAGRVLNVIASSASVVAALTVLLPFVARAATGVPAPALPAPLCLTTDKSPCVMEASAYLKQVAQHHVPYSDLLAVATLGFFFATVVWFGAALTSALKK